MKEEYFRPINLMHVDNRPCISVSINTITFIYVDMKHLTKYYYTLSLLSKIPIKFDTNLDHHGKRMFHTCLLMGMCVALNLNVKGVRVYIREGVHTLRQARLDRAWAYMYVGCWIHR